MNLILVRLLRFIQSNSEEFKTGLNLFLPMAERLIVVQMMRLRCNGGSPGPIQPGAVA